MFNYSNPYYNNLLTQIQNYSIYPVAKIEEAEAIYPEFNRKPIFIYDQSRNEIFVKQRNMNTGTIELIRYVLSNEPLSHVKQVESSNAYEEEISALKHELNGLKEMLKPKKEVKKDDE